MNEQHTSCSGAWSMVFAGIACVLTLACLAGWTAQDNDDGAQRTPRFVAVDVVVEAGDRELAAYQVRVEPAQVAAWDAGGREGDRPAARAQIVGIEGGGVEAFREAPYYDQRAMSRDIVVIGALNTGKDVALPSGGVRVARIHLRLDAGVDVREHFEVTLVAAASAEGEELDAKASLAAVVGHGAGVGDGTNGAHE